MKRRDFMALVGGAAAAWPFAARAQQGGAIRRIGVLMGWSEGDPAYRSQIDGFVQMLSQLGWAEGRNLRVDVRWTGGNVQRAGLLAKELVALQPDIMLVSTTPATAALLRETHTIPIVFAVVSDPVGAGFIASLPRPGGNITGFTNIEAGMGGKWLELLKEVAPRIRRAAIMFNPDTAPGAGLYYLAPFEAAARALGVEQETFRVHSDAEIDAAIGALGRQEAGLVAMDDSFTGNHRGTIISLAARNKVPTIFSIDFAPREGGLISYGTSNADIFRRAAAYVDRILRGERPADLPVQGPTKFELVINLKTAKALGLEVPASMQQLADEVIE